MFKKIYIEITNICNLKCKFCPDTKRLKETMSIENFNKIISNIKGYTNLVYLHVKGEPLLHNNLREILNILENNNLKCNITTNGTLLNDRFDIIKDSKCIRQINISLHSMNQNNMDSNKYLDDIFSIVNKLNNKVISLRLWNLENINDNDINNNIIARIEKEYNIVNLKQTLKENKSYKIKDNLYINQDIEFTWPNISKEKIITKGRCLALKDQIAILVDGTVVPCCLDNNGDIALGNIFKESIEEILNKDLTKQIKTNFSNNIITCDLCKTCGFLKRLQDKRKGE